jgi:UDP-N-acetylglucosamine--N-acetylmuramyl-(pentapeptide) pyrophosphoryl-undecaprenol N-acetylglucosamine transferase
MADAPRILMAAGGTGGHIFPARAAAEALIEQGWQVRLVTDARGAVHARDFPGEGVDEIAAASPFVTHPVRLARALRDISKGMGQTRKIFARFHPDVVAGFGGYPAFPAMASARLSGIPFVIHEQNAVLGRVNRLFAGRAFAVASGFDRLDRLNPKANHAVTGNPVRAAVLGNARPYAAPQAGGPVRLLVIGGSLGARILSEAVPRAVAMLPEALRSRVEVVQQTRPESLDLARGVYEEAGVRAVCEPFFEDMGALYADAHLVIARAGASTVSEVAAMGRPAVFIPLAIAMDDHQRANAEGLVRAGAAEMMLETEFGAEALSRRLETLLADGAGLAARAEAARRAGKPDAHARLAALIQSARQEP